VYNLKHLLKMGPGPVGIRPNYEVRPDFKRELALLYDPVPSTNRTPKKPLGKNPTSTIKENKHARFWIAIFGVG